jgi:hypothetical protein
MLIEFTMSDAVFPAIIHSCTKTKFNIWKFATIATHVKNVHTGRRNWGAGGAAAPVALYQEGQGGQRCPFNLKDCLGEIANCQKC